MVKTRKNQKKQRGGGWFGSNAPIQTSCVTDIENYMKNKFTSDMDISNLKTISSNIAACGKSNNIDNNVKSTLYDYMKQINIKLADMKSACNKNVDAGVDAAQTSEWEAKQKRIRDDIEKRRAQQTPSANSTVLPKSTKYEALSKELRDKNIEEYRKQNPNPRGGNRKSKRKSRKNIKKSKNNKR
jgi:hypothetical protein